MIMASSISGRMSKIPDKYIPKKELTPAQQFRQKRAIEQSKRAAKKGIFETRPKIEGFKSKKSSFTKKAEEKGISGSIDKIADKITKSDKRKKEVKKGLQEIMSKGRGAYFSSGSRPNTTPTQWGKARIYSVLLGGASRKVDKNIVDKYNLPLIK